MLNTLSVTEEKQSWGGMRYIREVLPGVLWRGGGTAGNEGPLTSEQLDALCTQGFTSVDYAYIGQSPETLCGGKMIYRSVPNAPTRAQDFLTDVYNAIQNNEKVMVHCWNGWHESGEMSAYAIKQFCSTSASPNRPNAWTTSQIQEYWKEAIGDVFEPAYQGVINNIGSMPIVPSLKISDEVANKICPNPNSSN
jgi:hypothetical protein